MGTSANRLALSVDAHPDHMDGFLTASQLLAGLVTDSISPPKILVVTLEGRSGTFGATDWQIEEHRLSTAEPTVMLPWEDQAFDAVCAIDVIDRMAPTQRGLFVAECLRLGRAGAILSHPGDHPHILQAEQFVQFLYRERFRTSHPAFSADAVQRPSALEMKNMLHEQSLPFTEVQDAPLHEWVNAQIRHDHGLQHPGQREEFATSSINYRHFYCISKSSDLKHRDVEWSARSDETSRGEAILFPGIARTLGKMLSEGDAQKAQQTVRAQRYETQASALDRLLRKTNWQRLARGGRFSISQGDLVPGPHLVPCADQPLTWRCRDEHPYFEATCPFPHGWIQIQVRIARLDGQTPRRETAEIFADFGAGYAHSQPLERVDWCEKLDQSELYIYLPRPAIGLRVRPLEGPAIFTVEQFSAACVSTRKVLMLAIKRKVHLVRRSRRMSQSLLRAVELFLTGRWLGLWRRVFKALPDSVVTRPAADVLPELGNSWCRRKPLPDAERIRSMAEIEAIAAPPVLSLMLPVDEMPDALLRTIVESIRGQTYPHWQLVAHLSPRTPYPHPVLEPYAQSDVRIRVVAALTEDDPEGAWHDWLEAVETPYAVVINPGYELAETALHRLAIHLSANPATELVINRNAPALSSGHCPDREIRLFRTGDGGGQLNVFRIEDLRSLRNKPDFRSMPLGLELARQLVQRGNKASYLAESLTYHCATLAQVPIATSDDQRLLNQVGPKKASQSLMITGDIIGITGWDQLVFEIARGLHSIGFDVRLNHECAITTELLPPYMVPLIRRRTPQDRELTICSPYFLNHHKPLPGNAIFTMWEADEFEPEWIAILNRASRVFVPSQWGADCLRSAGVSTPVFVIPLGHDPLTFCADADLPDICTFGTAAALWGGGIRKNTQRLIELFQKAFPDETDVRLRVKVTSRCEIPDCDDSRIEILRTYLRPEDLADWYRSLTVFVNTSYSEGFGLHLLEAMACGRALISTHYSGVTAYFDKEVGYRVEERCIPIQDNPIYRGHWAEPIDSSLIAALRRVYENAEEARSKGRRAAVRARNLTWTATGRKLAKLLVPRTN